MDLIECQSNQHVHSEWCPRQTSALALSNYSRLILLVTLTFTQPLSELIIKVAPKASQGVDFINYELCSKNASITAEFRYLITSFPKYHLAKRSISQPRHLGHIPCRLTHRFAGLLRSWHIVRHLARCRRRRTLQAGRLPVKLRRW